MGYGGEGTERDIREWRNLPLEVGVVFLKRFRAHGEHVLFGPIIFLFLISNAWIVHLNLDRSSLSLPRRSRSSIQYTGVDVARW